MCKLLRLKNGEELKNAPATDKQQLKAKMPAAGATQALLLFNSPLYVINCSKKAAEEKNNENEIP